MGIAPTEQTGTFDELEATMFVYRMAAKEAGMPTDRTPPAQTADRDRKRRQLDEAVVGFRMARRAAGDVGSWVRTVRQLARVPVEELAQKMGVTRCEVFRIERAEVTGRIALWKLRQAAEALDCDLVYALAPREGTLESLAARREEARDEERKRRTMLAHRKLEAWGGVAALKKAVHRELRKAGMRVRS